MFGKILGAVTGSTAEKAGKTIAGGAQQAIDLQKQIYNQSRADAMPWLTSGTAANNKLSIMLGLTPTTTKGERVFDAAKYLAKYQDVARDRHYGSNPLKHWNDYGQREGRQGFWIEPEVIDNTKDPLWGALNNMFDEEDFRKDPGYEFNLNEGQKAIDRSAAARGGLLSGEAVKAGQRFAQGLADQTYQDAYNRFNNDQNTLYNRIAGVSGTGQVQANNLGTMGANYANSVSDLYGTQASAIANGRIAQANQINKTLGSLFGY